MGLKKLTIHPEKKNGGLGEPIEVLFNPERYSASKSVQLAEVAIPGLDAPVVQYVRGQAEKITMELFFDTTGRGTVGNVQDVRELTNKVYSLLRVNGDLHAPPRCRLEWGKAGKLFSYDTHISPWCVLESVSEEFSLFSPEGVPLRAKLNVSFREAWTIEQQLQETPRHTADRTRVRTLEPGQTLSLLAAEEYQDPEAWRRIALANEIDHPLRVPPGTRLVLPREQAEVG